MTKKVESVEQDKVLKTELVKKENEVTTQEDIKPKTTEAKDEKDKKEKDVIGDKTKPTDIAQKEATDKKTEEEGSLKTEKLKSEDKQTESNEENGSKDAKKKRVKGVGKKSKEDERQKDIGKENIVTKDQKGKETLEDQKISNLEVKDENKTADKEKTSLESVPTVPEDKLLADKAVEEVAQKQKQDKESVENKEIKDNKVDFEKLPEKPLKKKDKSETEIQEKEKTKKKTVSPEVKAKEQEKVEKTDKDVKGTEIKDESATAVNGDIQKVQKEKEVFKLQKEEQREEIKSHEDVKKSRERIGRTSKNLKSDIKQEDKIDKDEKREDKDFVNGTSYVSFINTNDTEWHHLDKHVTLETKEIRPDIDLDIYKPTSYHGPRFSERKPTFTTNLTSRTATVGCRVKMTCSVIGEGIEINWLKNGNLVSSEANYYTEYSNNVATLEILNTSPNDSAEYSCVAKNEHGVSSTSADLKIIEGFDPSPLPPTFTRPIQDYYRIKQNELTLECRIRSQPAPTLKWYKNGEELSLGMRIAQSYLADGICKLTISNPDKSDSGRYTCRAENKSWADQISHDVKFTSKEDYIKQKSEHRSISRSTTSESRRPYFSGVLTDNFVPSGGVMALQVQVKGSPAEVTWFKESAKLPKASPKHRTFEEHGVHTLVIPNIDEYQAGKYTCRASNSYGRIESSAYVQVVHPSQIREGKPAMFLSRPEKILNVATGEDIVVSFRVTGDPKPRVTWMKGLKDITDSLRSLKETSDDYVRFTLKRATNDDVGTYCILAKNRHGCDRAFFTVRLRYRARSVTPSREGAQQILSDIPSYRERRSMTDVPGPIPGEPVVVDTGRNWISLSWGKPEHRGASPIVAYRVDAWLRGGEGARWVELGMSPRNTFDAFNLKPGGEYQFRITPRNRYGWGEGVQSGTIVVGKHSALPEFTKILPGQLKALLGSDIAFECEVRGDPAPIITWSKDSIEIFEEDDDRYTITQKGGLCSLTISNLQEVDSGRFMCEAVNKIGRVSSFARLCVIKDPKILTADKNLKLSIRDFDKTTELPPQFTMRVRDRRVQMSYPVRLTCQVAGCPEPTVKWFKDGQEIQKDARHVFSTEDNFHTLEIDKTHLEDSGVYSATAQNTYGSVSCRCNLVVDKGIKAYISPEFSSHLELSSSEVKEGSELRLSAIVEAYPTVGVMWYRNGLKLRPSRRSVMTLSYDGRVELSIGGVTKKDAGVYTCVAANEVGRAESSAKVEVIDGKSLTVPQEQSSKKDIPYSKEPKFLKKPRSTDAYEGDNIVILCEVIGDPKPEVVWLRDFLKPDYYRDAAHFHRVGDGPEYRLEIPNAKLDYTGTYTVYAKNCNGDTKAIISLQIKVRDPKVSTGTMEKKKIGDVQTIPKILVDLRDIRCCDGDAATLECKVEATPPPDIRWEKGGKLVHLGGDFNAEFDGETARLSINQVYPEDEGEYTCVAYNELGKAITSACLIVDIPEEKESLLNQQLRRPSGFMNGSTPMSTPRTTPNRSVSPRPRYREIVSTETRMRRMRAAAPKFYAYPHNRVAEEGETVRFQCAVAGHPDPWVTWEKDGEVVTPSARLKITENEDLRTLEIKEVTPSDSGVYKIILENDVGRVEASARLDVIAHREVSSRGIRARSLSPKSVPTYTRGLIGASARYGSRARLFSDIRAVPTPFLRWYKDGVPLDDCQKYKSSYDGKVAALEIDNVTYEDVGLYTCVAKNKHGSAETCAQLEVFKEENLPPEILEGLPKKFNGTEGTSVTMIIKAIGTQPFDVVWMKDGCILPNCADFRQVHEDDGTISLLLSDVYHEDAGNYRCEIYNVYGDAFSTCQLVVHERTSGSGKIEFSKPPSPVITTEGGNASFCVRISSTTNERPEIQWEVAGKVVTPSDKFIVEEDGDVSILHITGVTWADGGQVRCTATPHSEEVPVASCSTELTVARDLDAFDDGNSDSGTSMDVLGEDPPPEEPAMLLRGPQDATALVGDRVLLKATYMGQPEPTARWTRAGRLLKNDERTSITSGDGVSCLLLQNITADDSGKYDICVENIHGADCNYASVSVEGPPDPPSGTPCITADSGSVTVAWSSSPYDGGKIVNGYAVEYSLVGSDIWTTVVEECHSLSYVVRGLQPGGRYVFRVRALNVHGYSKPSLESDIVQLEEHNESSTFEPRIVSIEPGQEFKDRYEVLEELGKGRFGVVHKVVDKATYQKLAAKFIKCRTSKDRDKVQDEIDIMNVLRHQKLLQMAAAFENPREMIMIMEYISGGELFERVVADDFTLTEKDCILFMRQICEGVAYMHSQNVVHLDLKPENIMCHTRTSHEIKIIDFGLAQTLHPNNPIRVLFGTPEFIPPEIINYEPIGVESDMWSLGVICYVLLSGLSPFMGDTDSETFANITRADYDFEDEAFNTVSQNARDFIAALLVKRKENRLSAEQCLKHVWLDPDTHQETVVLSTDKLKKFIIRRKWQKTGNAIRALGRMATLSASRRNSSNSTPNTPRLSLSGTSASKMSSLNEEESANTNTNGTCEITNGFAKIELDVAPEEKTDTEVIGIEEPTTIQTEEVISEPQPTIIHKLNGDNGKIIRTRACSERSDSGISDCSSHLTSSSCTSTPLLGKKFCINEEAEYDNNNNDDRKFSSCATLMLSNTLMKNNEKTRSSSPVNPYRSEHMKIIREDNKAVLLNVDDEIKQSSLSIKLSNKFETFNGNTPVKSKSPSAAGSLKRLPIYTSRTVAGTIKKFDLPPEIAEKSPTNDIPKIEESVLKPKTVFNKFNDDQNSEPLDATKIKICGQIVNKHSSPRQSKVDRIVEKLSNTSKTTNGNALSSAPTTVKYRSPSPSLLRKTQAVIAKEQCNEFYMAKHSLKSPANSPKLPSKFNNGRISPKPKSPIVNKKDKPKSESFQKAAAFWNSPKT